MLRSARPRRERPQGETWRIPRSPPRREAERVLVERAYKRERRRRSNSNDALPIATSVGVLERPHPARGALRDSPGRSAVAPAAGARAQTPGERERCGARARAVPAPNAVLRPCARAPRGTRLARNRASRAEDSLARLARLELVLSLRGRALTASCRAGRRSQPLVAWTGVRGLLSRGRVLPGPER